MDGGKILALDAAVPPGGPAETTFGQRSKKGGRLTGSRSFLLLQGPVGPFFRQLRRSLRRQGFTVRKVAFWGGDLVDVPNSLIFRDRFENWADWLRQTIARLGITDLVMFGDERPYHRVARAVAQELGLNALVFEEGYLRPNFVTIDLGGANGNSSITERLSQVLKTRTMPQRIPTRREEPVGSWIPSAVVCVIKHHLPGWLSRSLFPHYRHYRKDTTKTEALGYTRHWMTRRWRQRDAHRILARLRDLTGRRYFFPLQMDNDAQLRVHSGFASVADSLRHVMVSFAQSAPHDAHLIIKPHPFDLRCMQHRAWAEELARGLSLQGRVHWIDGAATKDLILMSQGVVTVNSTTGLQALYHGRPVKALGVALWDAPGMTHQDSLDSFWLRPEWPSAAAVKRFRFWLWRETQINGNFYSRRGRKLALEATVERLMAAPVKARPLVGFQPSTSFQPSGVGMLQGLAAQQ